MKQNLKINRLFSIFCWLGTAISGILMGYMLHMAREYPQVDDFTRNTRIAGVLLLIWLAVSVFFTVRAVLDKQEKK
ncbi:MAG: hypothetical protein E7425_07350 [Ruminococcaceae bacterium]|nr:hypothetical protein [Oscillospiraceae bacterium]